MRVGWAGIRARGVADRDVVDVYLRQSGLLDWEYDGVVEHSETRQEETPLERQQRKMRETS